MSLFKGLVNGALAGAAGTTALNAVSYLDMVWRGGRRARRPPTQWSGWPNGQE
jgi:hypothetical protein